MKRKRKAATTALVITVAFVFFGLTVSGSAVAGKKAGYLGVFLKDLTEDLRESLDYDGDGVLIENVQKETPAAEAGIEAGDIVIKCAGKEVKDSGQLRKIIMNTEPGEKIKIVVLRNGKKKTIKTKIGDRADFESADIRVYKKRPDDDCKHKEFHILGDEPFVIFEGCGNKAFLGIHMDDMSKGLAEYFGVKGGALVTEVIEDTPAEKAGIKAGDVIVEFKSREVEDTRDLSYFIGRMEPGDKVTVKVVRREKPMAFDVELSETPAKCKCSLNELRHLDKLKSLDINLEGLETDLEGLEKELQDRSKNLEEMLQEERMNVRN